MILIENRNVLLKKDKELLKQLTIIENSGKKGNTVMEYAKNGMPTLKLVHDGKAQYLHSKYDPEKDAERMLSKYGSKGVKHILFIGLGLGYHIHKFVQTHPTTKFSIYEPNEEVLLEYLEHFELEALPLHNLTRIYTGVDINKISINTQQVLQSANGMLQIITLPVYEKIYTKQIEEIAKQLVGVLKIKRGNLATTLLHQKRWTINSVKNFPVLLKTANILHDIDRNKFRSKPAIIVSAGPSLNDEFENLRYIKEKELAYIFSVGSAINSLVEHGIYPDATCSFDPQAHNYKVIQIIKDKNIETIPLIFGSTIGYESLENYPGKMFHMITSPDKVSPQLLDTTQSIDIVWDAPTIAATTFQLLSHLQCSPIILVGQNLAYKEDKRYASGILYDFVENELNEEEKRNSVIVKDVYGENIKSNDSFNSMRRQLELYIQIHKNIEVINTTKGGAHIQGTSFRYLEDLIKDRLVSKIVRYDWSDESGSYDLNFILKRLDKLRQAEKEFEEKMQGTLFELEKIDSLVQKRQVESMEKSFVTFDTQFSMLKQNSFYIGFIEPMVKVQNERLSEESQFIRHESNILAKAELVVKEFTAFIMEVELHYEFVKPYFEELIMKIEEERVKF